MMMQKFMCSRCGRRLWKKHARLIAGKIMCSSCMLAPAKADRSPKGRDKGTLGSVHESGGPEGICPTSSSQQHQER